MSLNNKANSHMPYIEQESPADARVTRDSSACTGADPGFAKGGGPWRARGARAYNGGLGAEPPAGSRGRAPGGGSGAKTPEAESFFGHFYTKERPIVNHLNEMI